MWLPVPRACCPRASHGCCDGWQWAVCCTGRSEHGSQSGRRRRRARARSEGDVEYAGVRPKPPSRSRMFSRRIVFAVRSSLRMRQLVVCAAEHGAVEFISHVRSAA